MEFIELYEENVTKYTEKKGNLTYLSWSYAQKKGRELDPDFNWELIPKNDETLVHDGMVLVQITFKGKPYRHYFPILDYKNKAIANPNGFDINTAQMRGMAKLFAMVSGYGLSLYTGEDISGQGESGKQQEELKALLIEFNKIIKVAAKNDKEKAQRVLIENGAYDENGEAVSSKVFTLDSATVAKINKELKAIKKAYAKKEKSADEQYSEYDSYFHDEGK